MNRVCQGSRLSKSVAMGLSYALNSPLSKKLLGMRSAHWGSHWEAYHLTIASPCLDLMHVGFLGQNAGINCAASQQYTFAS